MGTPQRFEIDSKDVAPITSKIQARHPGGEGFLESIWANHAQDSTDGILGRGTIAQPDVLLEPREPGLCKQLDVFPAVSTTKNGKNRQNKDILEIVDFRPINPRIFENRHALNQTQLRNQALDSRKRTASISEIFRC